MGEDNDNGLGGGKEVKRYRKYTPWTLPRTRKDIFWKGEWGISVVKEKNRPGGGRGGCVG